MFSTFKIFVIYLIIPSSCANILPPNGEKTTLSSMEQVKKESDPIKSSIKKIMDALPSVDLKVELGVLQGKVEEIIKRAVKADRLLMDLGALRTQKETFGKMLRLLGVRSRVETLVDDLYPFRRPFHVSVAKAYEEILTSTKPDFQNRSCIIVFRQRVKSYGISTRDFLDSIRSIYGSMSDKAAHKMSRFEPSPPKYNDVKGIVEMYENFGICPDEGKIKTAQIILEPLPLLSSPAPTS